MTDEFDKLLSGFQGSQVTTLIRYRAGGQPGANWGYAGNTARATPGAMLLVGSAQWTGVAATSGGFDVALPARFAGPPIAIASPVLTDPAFQDVRILVAADPYQLSVYWWSGANITRLWVHWLAAGMPVTG